jgi:membrane protein implicated in regulation of membrane protease activity
LEQALDVLGSLTDPAPVDKDLVTLLWLVGGLLLVASEVFVPGVVAVFLGASAMLVALSRWLGLFESAGASLLAWMGLSVTMTLVLRRTVTRYFPAETRHEPHQPEVVAFGREVEVLETISDGDANGRIRWEGTSWQATSTAGVIPPGGRVRLVYRNNLTWVVEPMEPAAAPFLPPKDSTS